MRSSKGMRWTVLLTALAATVLAIFYPAEEYQELPVVEANLRKPVVLAASLTVTPAQTTRVWYASSENPFAPRLWEPPAPAAAPVDTRQVQQVDIAQAAVEQPPPPLPYKFLGQMQNGGERIFYLGRDEQVLLARKGDVLESSYKVIEASDARIEFESIQSGIKQSLQIPVQ